MYEYPYMRREAMTHIKLKLGFMDKLARTLLGSCVKRMSL